MKKMKLIPFLAVLFMLNLASCSSDGDTNYNTAVTPTPTQVVNNINDGSWRVLIYSENGTVNTAQFSGYNFTFGGGNALAANNGTILQTGSWDTYNDSGTTKMDLLFSTGSGPFASISEDWSVLTSTSSKIELQNLSSTSGGVDLLTLVKN